jgi:hypothetical protein
MLELKTCFLHIENNVKVQYKAVKDNGRKTSSLNSCLDKIPFYINKASLERLSSWTLNSNYVKGVFKN